MSRDFESTHFYANILPLENFQTKYFSCNVWDMWVSKVGCMYIFFCNDFMFSFLLHICLSVYIIFGQKNISRTNQKRRYTNDGKRREFSLSVAVEWSCCCCSFVFSYIYKNDLTSKYIPVMRILLIRVFFIILCVLYASSQTVYMVEWMNE